MKHLLSILLLCIFWNVNAQSLPEPQLYGLYAPGNELKKYADDLDRLGVKWFRVGGMNDQTALLGAEKGYNLIPVISLRKISLNNTVPVDQIPQVMEEWRKHVQDQVKRYGPDGTLWKENPQIKALPVRYWQIWNEPNIEFLNPPQGMSRVQLYAEILKAASEEIRKLDPKAKIIAFNPAGGSMTGKPSPDVYVPQFQYYGWRRFIKETVQLTGADCFDAVGLHPYSMPLGPEKGGIAKALNLMNEVAAELKFDNKEVWYTEVGYPLEYPRNQQVRDERQQACFTSRLYAISAAHGVTQVQNMYMVDIIYSQDNTRRSFGFFTAPGHWREQATALQTMISIMPDPRKNATIIEESDNGINAYNFKGTNNLPVIIAWNAGEGSIEKEYTVDGKKAVVVDMLGKEVKALDINKGLVKVTLTEAPVYIISASKKDVEKILQKK